MVFRVVRIGLTKPPVLAWMSLSWNGSGRLSSHTVGAADIRILPEAGGAPPAPTLQLSSTGHGSAAASPRADPGRSDNPPAYRLQYPLTTDPAPAPAKDPDAGGSGQFNFWFSSIWGSSTPEAAATGQMGCAIAGRLHEALRRELGGLNAESTYRLVPVTQVFDEFDRGNSARGSGNRDFPIDVTQLCTVAHEYLHAMPRSTAAYPVR